MSESTTTKPTAAAMRAARRLWLGVENETDDERLATEKEAALIIDRETGLPELLAAVRAWLEFNRETKAENPCPDLLLRANLREQAKALSIAAVKKAEGTAPAK